MKVPVRCQNQFKGTSEEQLHIGNQEHSKHFLINVRQLNGFSKGHDQDSVLSQTLTSLLKALFSTRLKHWSSVSVVVGHVSPNFSKNSVELVQGRFPKLDTNHPHYLVKFVILHTGIRFRWLVFKENPIKQFQLLTSGVSSQFFCQLTPATPTPAPWL